MIARRTVIIGIAASLGAPVVEAQVLLQPNEILRGRFTQDRHLKGFARPIRSEGSFTLVPGRGLIWKTEKPLAATTVITPAGLLQVADGQELTRLPTSRLPFLARLFDILGAALGGEWSGMAGSFAVAQVREADGTRLTLTPIAKDESALSRIQSIVVKAGRFAETVDIRRGDDDFDRITFSHQIADTSVLTDDEKSLFAAIQP
jgi:hypothetical protein